VNSIIISTYAWAVNLRDSAAKALRSGLEALKPESGQDLMEYAVLAGAIAVAAGFALFALRDTGIWDDFTGTIQACITFDSSCGD
jgi:Flp pilus assembly pilin Flp